MRETLTTFACLAFVRFLPVVPAMLVACGGDDGASDAADTVEVADTSADVSDGDGAPDSVVGDTLIQPEVEVVEEVAQPLDAPAGVWTWFDQIGSACSDGSPTGFAVNRGTSDDVLVVFNGGGACWDFDTCFLLNAATAGPFQKGQFEALAAGISAGVLDRGDDQNPYRTWTQVFVPYCTGDLHAGDNDATYISGGLTKVWHHRGARNARLALERLAVTFPKPDKLVVAGLSAGGYGATLLYPTVRDAFDATTTQLVDDSGPLLVGTAIPPAMRSQWFQQWRLDLVVDPVCGQACKDDLSVYYGKLAALFPNDRMALTSSLQDAVIAGYMGLTADGMKGALRDLGGVFAALPTWRMFLVLGDSHTMLANPSAFSTNGIDLRTWLGLMVDGDAGWDNVLPQ